MGLWVVVHPHTSGCKEPSMPTPSTDYRLIPLSQGQFAKVSPHRFDELMQWKWYALWYRNINGFYAQRGVRLTIGGRKTRRTILMHRYILGLEYGDKREGDHANRETLDNQDGNLRIATRVQNQENSSIHKDNASGFKGIAFDKSSGLWFSRISFYGKRIYLGHFRTPEAAHESYCAAAKEIFGEFARKE